MITIKGTDEILEIHLVYKHPKLDTLVGKTLPKIGLCDLNGKPIELGKSEYAVVCFLNKYCSVCIRELIALNILAEDYPKVLFIGLTPDSPEEVQRLMKKLKLDWENIRIVPNYNEEFIDLLKIYVYPSNIIVDKDMRVKEANTGGNTRKLLRALERLCGE